MTRIDTDRRPVWFCLAIALMVAITTMSTGAAEWIERTLAPARFAVWERAPSGRVVVVEMDAASAAAIRQWPWPRGHYAAVVDRLREAGAAGITSDVDFSSPSTPAGDAAFAAALARAEGLVALPTFSQVTTAGERRMIDTLPLPMFREHVALASVSILPDSDGLVRQAPLGTLTDGVPRPSLSASMAHRSGAVDAAFPIDYGIDPARLARLSFVAVRDGRFDPAVVRGREVIIGATAIEMGDRYAVPRWGVIPGVIVQALAAETLIRGVPATGSAFAPLLLAVILGAMLTRARRLAIIIGWTIATPFVLFAGSVVVAHAWQVVYPIAPALAFVATMATARLAMHVLARFEHQRLADEETGLPNRRAMAAALTGQRNLHVAVASIGNLDTLAAVLGEATTGDLVLRLADRLRLAAQGDVYRLSDRLLGFAVAPDAEQDRLLASLRAIMMQPVELRGRRVDATVAIGLADGDAFDTALNSAIRAADEAAQAGVFWRSSSTDLALLERQVSLMGELDQGIAAGDVVVHYQPKLALADDRIASVEALVRWKHPARGFIGPDLFIPLAEQTDRIEPLTLFVLERVMHDLARWRAAGHDLTAAVNVSAKLVASRSFDAGVRALLARNLVPPSTLILEVTESATLSDPVAAGAWLQSYRAMGIAISMDDYGTGQSTLSYLKSLPLSELKIDRSFVQHAHVNRADGLMVRSTVDLAHALGLKVVAEGIEEPGCLAFLQMIGCDMAQGYLISRPLPAADLETLLARPMSVSTLAA